MGNRLTKEKALPARLHCCERCRFIHLRQKVHVQAQDFVRATQRRLIQDIEQLHQLVDSLKCRKGRQVALDLPTNPAPPNNIPFALDQLWSLLVPSPQVAAAEWEAATFDSGAPICTSCGARHIGRLQSTRLPLLKQAERGLQLDVEVVTKPPKCRASSVHASANHTITIC